MPTDKEILFNIIGREIDNVMRINPAVNMFSNVVKRYVFNFIEPYVDLFMQGDDLQTDMASSFAKKEIANKIDQFKKEFKEAQDNEGESYI